MPVGNNVAPNLAGMFAEINKGIATDKTGEMYVDTFRRSMAPPIDMNDSSSILRYAEWAQKNGYEEEARNYLALGYRQKEKEEQLAKDKSRATVLAEASRRTKSRKSLATEGDTRALTLNRDALQAQLDKAVEQGDTALVTALTNRIDSIDAEMPGATSAKAKKGAAAIDKYQATLDGMQPTDPRRESLQKALDYLKNDPATQEAYRDLQKDKMSLQSSKNALTIQEQTIDSNNYDASLRPYEAKVRAIDLETKELRLIDAMQDVQNQQAVAADKIAERDAKSLVQGMTQKGVYDPARIPENIDPAIRAYAVEFLNTERAAKEQADLFSEANSKKVLTPYYYNEALKAAYVNPDAPIEEREVKNAKIAQLLQEYDRILNGGDGTINPAQLAPYTGQIVGAIKDRDAKQLAAIGNADIPAAQALQAFRLMPDSKGIFEPNSFHSLMDDSAKGQQRFIEMKQGLTQYMVDNGIEGFESVTELYAAMEDIAPTLSDPAWHKASNRNDIARKQGQQNFNRQMNAQEQAFVDSYVDVYIAENPDQGEYKDIIEEQARDEYGARVGDAYDFFTVDNRWWMSNKGGLERHPETGIRLTPQMRMIMNASEGSEWDTVKEMLGEDLAAEVESRVMSGIPVRFEDLAY